MKQLFVIESPLQLINAYEALQTFSADKQIILVRLSGEHFNDNQIEKTIIKLDINNLAKIKYVTINVKKRNIIDYVKIILLKLLFFFIYKSYKTIYIGNYNSNFIRFIIPFKKNIMLIDDGSLTLNIQNKFSEKHYYNWFSIFDLVLITNQISIKNNYKHLNSKFIKNRIKNENIVLFIGSALYTYQIVTEEYYLRLISNISNRYNEKRIIYIPHRSEKSSMLVRINEFNNIEVKRLEYPIELFAINNNTIPSLIASFYSTALITLEKIYGVEAVAFKFNYATSIYKDDIDLVYEYYAKSIKIIDEDDI